VQSTDIAAFQRDYVINGMADAGYNAKVMRFVVRFSNR